MSKDALALQERAKEILNQLAEEGYNVAEVTSILALAQSYLHYCSAILFSLAAGRRTAE